ncbi:aldehyde dehydrogenase family protein [Granulosicoccus sp. 3-233]|uniref:aldehyde dehydrogenase family protein n=1 Tax=Granulosicoccus sp. 3-233 TaxID=3417969 RepID=UPI003D33D3EE
MKLPMLLNLGQQPLSATLPVTERPDNAEVFQSHDPACPEEVVASYCIASEAQTDEVLDRAQSAFQEWSALTGTQRVNAIGRWLERIEASTDDIALCMTAEQGKPLSESCAEIGKALREARQMLGFASSHAGCTLPGRSRGFRNIIMRRPHGIVLAIAPWNFPILTPLRKLVPALVTGNTVVLKPSEYSPAAAIALVTLAEGIIPEGALSLVNGKGAVAARLVAEDRIRAVSFTGSVDTGRKVAVAAAAGLKPVSLELGGKNAAILDEVADPGAAMDAIVGAAFQCSGQRCTSISRVIFRRHRLDEVVGGFRHRLDKLVAGPGRQAGTTLGPITTPEQLDKIERLVNEAIEGGAACLLGGHRLSPDEAPTGRFFAPTLLLCEDPSNVAVQEEIFGPVLTLQPCDSDDEALALLNNSRFGLTSAVFSDRVQFVNRALSEAQSGMIHINHGTVPDDNMPFVGIRDSGLGIGSVGASTLDFYTSEHSAYVAGY